MRETYHPQPPTSFPRRWESTPLRPNSRRDGPSPAVYRIRHSTTEFVELQRKLVRARARGNGVPFSFSRHGLLPSRSRFDVSLGVAAL